MRFQEIVMKIKNDEINLDSCGHEAWSPDKHLISHCEHLVEYANGKGDGTWSIRENETTDETNLGMRKFYQRMLDNEIEENQSIAGSYEAEHCSGCGERLQWVLNGNKLTLREFYNDQIQVPGKKWQGAFDLHPLDYRCPYEHPIAFGGEIKISSRLIFVNFFRGIEDAPEGKKYTREWSLNDLIGRDNITKYKCATQNIAYGQMSNMSIGIYVNENKDCVIVGPAYHPAECEEYDSDEAFEEAIKKPVFDGFEMVGTICLDVWRWEATDLATIGEENYDKLVEDHRNRGIVEIDVKHGIWKFEHYFDRTEDEFEDLCYSKFTLKND